MCVGGIKLGKLGTVNIVSPVNAQAVAMVIPKYPTSNTFRTLNNATVHFVGIRPFSGIKPEIPTSSTFPT